MKAKHKYKDVIKEYKIRADRYDMTCQRFISISQTVVDGLVLVIQNETTSKRFIPRIAQILKDSKAKVTGFILNKITQKSSNYYHYYYSKYYGNNIRLSTFKS